MDSQSFLDKKLKSETIIIPGSFRDLCGFVFSDKGVIYRQVNQTYREEYDYLMTSGCYDAAVDAGLLIPHLEVNIPPPDLKIAYKIIQPEPILFISYPYEWCFSQLKRAALATLELQKIALDFGMSLKDCTAYNIQFRGGRPVFIDTLSFEKYREGQPWVAYRQFCQHFLAPLALMSHKDVRLNQLFRVYLDGIPLDLASSLLPWRTRFHPALLLHIHFHARLQKKHAASLPRTRDRKLTHQGLIAIIENLESAVRKLKWTPGRTQWRDYYENTNYSLAAFDHKRQLVSEFLGRINPQMIWDLGANTGAFSRAGTSGVRTLSFDMDPAAVEINYLKCLKQGESHILPLVLDLTNPSPGLGWGHQERMAFLERGPADVVLVLALIHHLAIGNNLPFKQIADFFSHLCHWLIIEFVPKGDSQCEKLLCNREDIFNEYNQNLFENEFRDYFNIVSCVNITGTERFLYLMEVKSR